MGPYLERNNACCTDQTATGGARWMVRRCGRSRLRSSNAREIRLSFDLDADLSAEQRGRLLDLTERYCVVYQTLRNSPPINFG